MKNRYLVMIMLVYGLFSLPSINLNAQWEPANGVWLNGIFSLTFKDSLMFLSSTGKFSVSANQGYNWQQLKSYLYSLQAGSFTETKKLMLMK